MIRLFSHTETDFTHNGIHVLDDIALGDTCILSNGINEVYSLEMEVSIYNNSKWKDIESEMILKVPTSKGEQLFRIKEVVKGFNTIKIYGKHIFFDLENNFILDTNIVKKDGRSAIAQILGTMTNNMVNSFHGTSDISILNNSRLVRKNVVTALIGDGENSFLNRWGGELELDNFNFSINERIGSDRGFQIRYGKNATGYEGNINTYNLCTRIVPVGFDGIMLEGTKWVDSPNIAKYPQIYTYEVKFDDIKVKENADDEEGFETIEEARDALRQAALNHFNNTKCDLPSFSAVVNFITLRNTQEFKNVKALETVALGDDVSIYLSNIDVNASSRVVREKWNFFTKKHVELEIGEIKPNVFKQLINIKDTIDNIVENLGGNTWQDIINKSLDEATKLMEEGLKGSHVITMKNQIVIGDAPDIKDMVNCIVFNKNGIGFSNNGYLPDQLVSAMTIDGKINASCITVGELNAALIKTGTLMSANGTTWIDMENGTFNFADKVKFVGDTLEIKAKNTTIGEDGLTVNNGAITIKNNKGQDVLKGDAEGNLNLNIWGSKLTVSATGSRKAEMYCDYYDKFIINVPYTQENGGLWIKRDTGSTILSDIAGQGEYYSIYMGATRFESIKSLGGLTVSGSKNCLQKTENYGERLINAYETAEYFFGDIGSGIIKNGECIVLIDDILQECINTEIEYHVFTQVYNGSITSIEKYNTYFIVKGEDNTSFSWELKAKRKGYENVRLDTVDLFQLEEAQDPFYLLNDIDEVEKILLSEVLK